MKARMSSSYPEVIEVVGQDIVINVHEDGALALTPFNITSASGQIVDIAATPLVFRVKSIAFAKPLAANPADARGRGLALTKAECAAIPDGARWAIFDETDPASPLDQGKGWLRKYS